MENQKPKTEYIDIQDILKEDGIVTDAVEKEGEIDTDKLFQQLTNEEPIKEEIKIEPAPLEVTTTKYSEKIKDFISAGFLEDVQITIGEGDNSEMKFLSELKDLDSDTFTTIISEYKKAKDLELKEKYISREGLDERTEKYIELKKAGGDPNELIQEEIKYVNPWEKLDLDDEKVQEHIVRSSLAAQGLKPKFIDQEIEEMIDNVTLDVEANKIYKKVQKQFEDRVEAEKKNQLDRIEADKVEQKEFRKEVGQELKSLITNADVAKVILDNSTKRDENGLTNTDKLFFDAQKDPKLFAEVAFFLNNREEFYKTIGAEAKTKEAAKVVKTMLSINPTVVKTTMKEIKSETKGDEVFERLTKQYNQ